MKRREILARHKSSLRGRLRGCLLPSQALGFRKPFYVYEPPGLSELNALPSVYLFRGHEREWVNIEEDSSRTQSTAIEDVDKAISIGLLPPMLVVMPGLNSSNNHIPSLGINMVGTWPDTQRGLGSGNYWDFLTQELMPVIVARYPKANGPRLAAGFSLGGFTSSLLGIHKPGLFDQIGIYDGLFMWPKHTDPRQEEEAKEKGLGNDSVWTRGALFHAAFDNPRNVGAMNYWNPTDRLMAVDSQELAEMRNTKWWISCAVSDGQHGNRDRAEFYQQLLLEKGIPLGFDEVLFHEDASHSWHWADKFLISFLSGVFGSEMH